MTLQTYLWELCLQLAVPASSGWWTPGSTGQPSMTMYGFTAGVDTMPTGARCNMGRLKQPCACCLDATSAGVLLAKLRAPSLQSTTAYPALRTTTHSTPTCQRYSRVVL